MRKIVLFVFFLILTFLLLGLLVWEGRSSVAAHFLSGELKVPVSIQELDITKTQIDGSQLWIGTPNRSRTHTSFSAEAIEIDTEVLHLLSNPLLIDRIEVRDIFVGIEYYANGETNWDSLLKERSSSVKKDYLIGTLVLENLSIEVTQANGQKKRYPKIERMEFHDISSESGFPIDQIEKAIFKMMMKEIFQKFNLLKDIPGVSNSPLKYLIPLK